VTGHEVNILSHEEREAIINRLKNQPMSIETGELITTDIESSSRITPYYRNFKHRLFSVFEDCPGELQVLQDISLLLIDKVSNATITRIPYAGNNPKAAYKFTQIGNIEVAKRLSEELIIILQLRDDIDYTLTRIKNPSPILKWILKYISMFSYSHGTGFHVVFDPQDHKVLQSLLNTESNRLVYRVILQIINLLIYHYKVLPGSPIKQKVDEFINPQSPNYVAVRRNVSDLKNIEPLYIWTCILSPVERREIVRFSGINNLFQLQSQLLQKWKSTNPGDAEKQLLQINDTLHKQLPQGVFAIIYGRLGHYRKIREDPSFSSNFGINPKTKTKAQAAYNAVVQMFQQTGKASLIAEENILWILYKYISRGTEITDLTQCTKYDPKTNRPHYYWGDILHSKSIARLADKARKGDLTAQTLWDELKTKSEGIPPFSRVVPQYGGVSPPGTNTQGSFRPLREVNAKPTRAEQFIFRKWRPATSSIFLSLAETGMARGFSPEDKSKAFEEIIETYKGLNEGSPLKDYLESVIKMVGQNDQLEELQGDPPQGLSDLKIW